MTAIVCLGEPLVEFTLLDDQADKRRVYLQGFGGDTSNCAIAAARFGAKISFVSALGDDRFAMMLRKLWDNEKIDHDNVKTNKTYPTGIYFVSPDPAGRNFQYYRKDSAASKISIDDIPVELIEQAKILHLSAISQAISETACAAAIYAMKIARAAGTLISYDTNLRLNLWPLDQATQTITAAIKNCDIALPSLDDSLLLTQLDDPDQIIDLYHDYGASIVALKLGADGAIVSDRNTRRKFAPYPVTAIDSTGAGDTFDGAFLATLLATDCPFESARRATIAAALTTTGMGAVAPIPYAQDIEKILAN